MDLSKLLYDLKQTTEGLLSVPTANVWSIYGGLKRLSMCVEKILNHGLKFSPQAQSHQTTAELDYNHFIKSLHWLNPVLAPSSEKIRKLALEENLSEGRAWVRHSLQNHTMSAQLKALVGDNQNLSNSYTDEAFLSHRDYFAALCICLEAVENNRPSLLTNIDHTLLVSSPTKSRASTLPLSSVSRTRQSNHLSESSAQTIDPLTNEISSQPMTLRSRESSNSLLLPPNSVDQQHRTMRSSTESDRLDAILNNEFDDDNDIQRSSSQQSSPKINKGKQPMKRQGGGHQRSKSELGFLKSQQLNAVVNSERGVDSSALSSSLPDTDSVMEKRMKSGGYSNNDFIFAAPGGGYFPQPRQGESLKSFLSSQDFDTCAELDKENAHFAISEALIAAIEHMKWNQVLRPAGDSNQTIVTPLEDSEVESDEEIVKLKQKIQERRKLRGNKKMYKLATSERSSSGATPRSSDHSNSLRGDSDSLFSEEGEELNSTFSDTDSMLTLRDGLTISDRLSDSGQGSTIIPSAEQVALSLLSQFNEYHLPKADQLVWLVSEKEAPQALLPMPTSLPISPDDMMEGRNGTRIRGNAEWAPPRPQIIFNIHPNPGRKILISKQNYRCAGCGAKIEEGYLKRFRYCEYLGKYFCHCCHTNQASVIPARILHKWEFTKYQVSNFSYDLLQRVAEEPLFNILDINPRLLRKVQTLQRITLSRLQLRFSRPFLASCRLGVEVNAKMQELPSYFMDDVHLYSITNLLNAKTRELDRSLQTLAKSVMSHIQNCELCKVKGFICEICDNDKEIIFPFQLEKVIRCNFCSSCYHMTCYNKKNKICPKCARVETRRQYLAADSPSPEPISPATEA